MNSLVLTKQGKVLFSSEKSGLRPLLECISQIKETDCILYDKVVGLASAKLIVYSNLASVVITDVISEPAKDLLITHQFNVTAKITVKNIFNKDHTNICPMERKAQELDIREFYNTLLNLL